MTTTTLLASTQSSIPFDEMIRILIASIVTALAGLIGIYLLFRSSRNGVPSDPDSQRANIDRLKLITGSNTNPGTDRDRTEDQN